MSNGSSRQVKISFDSGLKRDIGKTSLLFTGVGAIIGSGWLFGALYASQIAGPAAIFSWMIGALMFIIMGLVYAELATMFPVAGGVIRFPHYAFGSFAGFSTGWIVWLASAAVTPVEVLATIQYASPYLPGLMNKVNGVHVLTGHGAIVAVDLLFLYSLVNIMGVKMFTRFNNVLVWWKLAVIALTIAAFFFLHFHTANLTSHGLAPEGMGAIFTAIPAAGVAFAYLGFRNAVEYAGESSNPQRDVPYSIIGSIVITASIYVLLQLAFITALTPDLLTHGWAKLSFQEDAGPLAGLALILGGVWLAWILRIDAVISPADTGLIFSGVTARMSYANARNRNAPQWLTKLNDRGIPWVSIILMFVVGCIFFLPFPSWQLFMGFITSAFSISLGTGPVVVGAMRRELPDQERPFRLPCGDLFPVLSFICSSLLVFWSGWNVNEKMLYALLIGYVVYAIYRVTAQIRLPQPDFKAGLWFPVWITGLMLISYGGTITGSGHPLLLTHGGHGPLSMIWGGVECVCFSFLVYQLAIALRLPAKRVATHLQDTPTDEPAGQTD